MLKLKDITLSFGKNVVLIDLDLEYKNGEIIGCYAQWFR